MVITYFISGIRYQICASEDGDDNSLVSACFKVLAKSIVSVCHSKIVKEVLMS